MNNILKSLLTIGAVAAISGSALTAAYYMTQINANGNQVTTGTLNMTVNDQSGPLGPALFAANMYPGAFAESAAKIHNSGTIKLNPSISLASASDPNGLAPKLWLQIWTNGKLNYNNWITNAPGYTTGKVNLDSINPGEDAYVAFRLILDETATATGNYSVNVVVTGYQWNDPAGLTTAAVDVSPSYVATDWSYNVCGTRPTSPYYTYDGNFWKVQTTPFAATGTNPGGSCTVPF